MFLKIGCFHIARWDRICINESFEHLPTVVFLALSLFKLQERIPCILGWLPCHPILKDSPNLVSIAKHLLHQAIFVPELVNPRHVFACALPNIPCTLDKLVPHLHVCVFEPKCYVLEVNSYGTLKNGPCALKLTNTGLPFGIFQPCAHMVLLHAE